MDSINNIGSPFNSLYWQERQKILQQICTNFISLLNAYCPELDPAQVDTYLRSIDFSHLEQSEKAIINHILSELIASLPPPELVDVDPVAQSFTEALSQADVAAGGLQFLDEVGQPVSDEQLKSQGAALRASVLFTNRNGIDSENILYREIPTILANMVINTGHRIPKNLIHQIPLDSLRLIGMELPSGETPPDIDEMTEKNIQDLKLSPEVFRDNMEAVQEIRNAIRSALWKAQAIKDKTISRFKRQQFIAIKQFLYKYPNLSVLIHWLIGEKA